jgi:hypothetical protein
VECLTRKRRTGFLRKPAQKLQRTGIPSWTGRGSHHRRGGSSTLTAGVVGGGYLCMPAVTTRIGDRMIYGPWRFEFEVPNPQPGYLPQPESSSS